MFFCQKITFFCQKTVVTLYLFVTGGGHSTSQRPMLSPWRRVFEKRVGAKAPTDSFY